MYKEFNKGDFYLMNLQNYFQFIQNYQKQKNQVYQVCSLIYPSKFYKDSITKKTKQN